MDLEVSSPPRDLAPCCSCGCSCSSICGSTGTWLRSIKRKLDELEDGDRFVIPGLEFPSIARVQVENEIVALREMVTSQQETIKELCAELDEERNASESAANEAMSMILRLQREKAEIQMEARQFKRYAEEKMEHDQEEITALEDVLYKREQVIRSLNCEVQAYKHRMMSYGLTEAEADGEMSMGNCHNFDMLENANDQLDFLYKYPPLKCSTNATSGPLDAEDDNADIEKHAFGEIPYRREELKSLEYRIGEMERNPSPSQLGGDIPVSSCISEKVIVSQSPQQSRHSRRFANDNSSLLTGVGRENYTSSKIKGNALESQDDTIDRVYTVDSVHNALTETKTEAGMYRDYATSPMESLNQPENEDPDIKKLHVRLQALEADRESMRQAIISMRTEKAQLLLLKEIAQQLCKEILPERHMPMTKRSLVGSFNFMSIFKWVASFIFWRKKGRRSKYLFGQSANGVGLLMLLDKSSRSRQWRCVTSITSSQV